MRSVIAYFIKYPVWVSVLLIAVTLFGLASLKSMKTSFFAPIDPRLVSIRITYPGTSPQEIEEGIITKIEENLKGIQDVERITSISQENSGSISVEIRKGGNGNQVLQDVKNAVDKLSGLPPDMEPPIIYKVPIEDFAISFAVMGEVSLSALKATAKRIEQDLLSTSGISLVTISGLPDEEIEIQVSEYTLRQYDLTMEDIRKKIAQSNLDITGGTLKNDRTYYSIRSQTKPYYAKDLKNTVIKTNPNGQIVTLDQVATVTDTWADIPNQSYFNRTRSVTISVLKTTDEDILSITKHVNQYITNFNAQNDTIKLALIRDGSTILKQRIALLTKNGIIGFLLVFGLLAIFLNTRLAFWVASSIPISFLGMFIISYNTADMTINVISLFGMIVVIGILVDDGVVIGENVFQHYERGKSPGKAALDGTLEVLPSVVSSILTTIVAFTPFFFLDGRIADIMSDMAYVVIVTLAVSLIEASLILPSHLAHSTALKTKEKESKLQKWGNKLIKYIKTKLYKPILRFSLSHTAIVLLIPTLILVLTIGAAKGGIITSTFFPFVDADDITISVTLPAGAPSQHTLEVLSQIEEAVWEVGHALTSQRKDGLPIVQNISKEISSLRHKGSLNVTLLDGETRNLESFKITQEIRSKVGQIPGTESIEFGSRSAFGKPISISLLGSNLAELKLVKEKLKTSLATYSKVKDIIDNDQLGMQEIHIELTRQASLMGVTEASLMTQIRSAIFGLEVLRTQRGPDEVKVWLRYPKQDRNDIQNLEEMRIKTPNGTQVPLSALATLSFKRSPMLINHVGGLREVKVEADLANQKDPVPPILNTVIKEHLTPILAQHPTVRYALDGQKRQMDKTAKSAGTVIPLALLTMFFIITLSYRSFAQAGMTMLLIPFGYIGMGWGHFIHGMSISMLSIFGFIALIGILVNDSIVFTNTFNSLIRAKVSFKKALYKAGLSRCRPILLTSITTIAGLAPIIAEKSRQAQFLIPMAISVAYGLIVVTILILIVTPALLITLNILRRYTHYLRYGIMPSPESVEPAYQETTHDL